VPDHGGMPRLRQASGIILVFSPSFSAQYFFCYCGSYNRRRRLCSSKAADRRILMREPADRSATQLVLLLYKPPALTECQIATIAVLHRVYVKTQKIVTENSNLHGFELHRPSSKDTKILFQVIQAIINQVQIHMDSSSRCDVMVHIFCFLFLEEIFAREKKQKCKILYQAHRSAYICTWVPHTQKHICCRVEIESIWILRTLRFQVSRSHPDAWPKCAAEYPTYIVCLCVYAHVHQHTLQTQSKNRRKVLYDTYKTSIFPHTSVKNNVPRQQKCPA